MELPCSLWAEETGYACLPHRSLRKHDAGLGESCFEYRVGRADLKDCRREVHRILCVQALRRVCARRYAEIRDMRVDGYCYAQGTSR